MNLVDFRNLAEGDSQIFEVKDSLMYKVAKIADGTQALRRQRISGVERKTIDTEVRGIKFYDELNRILSGRADLGELITTCSNSFQNNIREDIHSLWLGATQSDFGGQVYFPTAGVYSESALLDVIAHVEAAANGKKATIICTKKRARTLAPSVQGIDSKSDLYNMGYYGSFYGTPIVVIPQRHKINSTVFTMDDDIITIIAGDDKPIKFVYEGDPLIIQGNPIDNQDLTQEYFVAEKYGMGIVLAGANAGIGRYEIA